MFPSISKFPICAYTSGKYTILTFLILLCWTPGKAFATPAPTNTKLAITSDGNVVSTVVSPAVVTLNVAVTVGGSPVTLGQVNFCDASTTTCTDIHLLGTAQLTSAGAATLKFRPGIGSHSYKAVFVGTIANASSASAASTLSVTGQFATTTSIAQSGSPSNYVLTAGVMGLPNLPTFGVPTGTVNFVDTSDNNTVLGTVTLSAGTPEVQFPNATILKTTQQANVAVAADFNGDGIPDLAISDANSNQTLLAIFLGNGDGTFAAVPTSPTVGLYPDSIAVADFNDDGIADMAVTSVDQNTVTILLGNGDGTFSSASPTLSTGSTPQSVVSGDFNNDGLADLAIVRNGSVLVYLGRGDGTFTQVSASTATGASPINAVAADFNRDGILDLAVTNSNDGTFNPSGSISILLGKGDGTFQPTASPLDTNGSPDGLAAADFNGDGILDLTFSDYGNIGTPAIGVLIGNGDGTFQPAAMYSAPGLNFHSVVVQDFNQDGVADIAVGEFWHGEMSVLFGKGDGTFAAGLPVSAQAQLGSGYLATADFNGDGVPDLAVPSQDGTTPILLTQLRQNATATVSGIAVSGSSPHEVVATYAGDSNYTGSTSGTTELKVQLPTPTISPASGPYTSSIIVTLTDATPGAVIYYLLSGTIRSSGYTPYTGPISLPYGGSQRIDYYAAASGYQQSSAGNATYALNLPAAATPSISPASGSYVAGQTVNISDTTAGATIYYTLNGATPNTSSAVYSGPLTISSNTTLKAVAIATGYSLSSGATALYTITVPTITWPAPAAIGYGTPLGTTQLNATANVPGSFVYTPAAGAVLQTGSQTLSVTFTPSGVTNPTPITSTVSLLVNQATPTITWSAPTPVTYGTVLSAAQLNATSPTSGSFVYTPGLGIVLPVGAQTLSAKIIPTDTVNYTTQTATVPLQVNKAMLTITANNFTRVYGIANPTFTGAISGVVNGDTITESFSTAATASSIVGSYPIVPSAAGTNTSNYMVSVSSGTLTVTPAGTTTTLALSNSNLALTATVASVTTGLPTGTVNFYQGQTLAGSATLSNGTATFALSAAPTASASFSVQYGGDGNFTASSSNPVTVLTSAASQTSLTVSRSGSVSDTVLFTGAPGFAGTLQFSCTGLPAGSACSFQPSSLSLSNSAETGSTTVTIQTGVSSSFAAPHLLQSDGFTAFGMLLWLPGLGLAPLLRRKSLPRLSSALLLLFLLAMTCWTLNGCGSDPQTTAETATVQVVASGASGFVQTTNISLSVK